MVLVLENLYLEILYIQTYPEDEALLACIKDNVTDGQGMGFGLFSTLKLVENAGIKMNIMSGNYMLTTDGTNIEVNKNSYWQGTVVYFELHSNKEIKPNELLGNRVDCESEFNDDFIESDDLDNLW